MSKYPHLFSPLTILGTTLPNRVCMLPMGTSFTAVDGSITPDQTTYYAQRAAGGTGLITIENMCVDFPLASNGTTQPRIDDNQFMPPVYNLIEALHAHGAKVAIQLNHAGSAAYAGRLGGLQPVSASTRSYRKGAPTPRALRHEELPDITDHFAHAALRVKNLGADFVEIHGGHTYLLNQFLSPLMNQRTDIFGGSAPNRARFPAMVLHAVRQAVGPRFPVILRINGDDLLPGGNTLDDVLELLAHLVPLVDVLSVTAAVGDNPHRMFDIMGFPDGWRAHMAGRIKKTFNIPVIACGNLRQPAMADELIAQGDADIIGMGRALIADPDWCLKAESGRENMIRPCLSCNIGCIEHRSRKHLPIRCSVNPSVIHHDAHKQLQLPAPFRVSVIGAGVAGLEAACTAAEMGCEVDVFEMTDRVGGLARAVSTLPGKKRLKNFIDYLTTRAQGLPGLHLHCGVKADKHHILESHPDLLVMATGAIPSLPPIPGLSEAIKDPQQQIFTIVDLLNDLSSFLDMKGKRIVIVGGGGIGLDLAEFFVSETKAPEIHLVEMLPSVGRDLDGITLASLGDWLFDERIKTYTSTRLTAVLNGSLQFQQGEHHFDLPFDKAFMCLGLRSQALVDFADSDMQAQGTHLVTLGDASMPRKIIDATREARALTNTIVRLATLKAAKALSVRSTP